MNTMRMAAEVLRLLPRKRLSRAMGAAADLRLPSAVVERSVAAFVRQYRVNLDEAIIPGGGFTSFDEFFTRKLKPGARPLDADVSAVLSPADGRVDSLGEIDGKGHLVVKDKNYTVNELIGDDALSQAFCGGKFFIVYLSPRDYHRVHAPVSGAVRSCRYLGGTLFPVNQIGIDYVPSLFAKNERVAVDQQTAQGAVTTVMVGAIGVGRMSVSFDDLITNSGQGPCSKSYGDDGPPMERGDEIGTFHLGSTAIVFLPPTLSDGLQWAIEPGAVVSMGQALLRPRGIG